MELVSVTFVTVKTNDTSISSAYLYPVIGWALDDGRALIQKAYTVEKVWSIGELPTGKDRWDVSVRRADAITLWLTATGYTKEQGDALGSVWRRYS